MEVFRPETIEYVVHVMFFCNCIKYLTPRNHYGVTRLTETKPKYRNETEIRKRTIKNIGKESNLHLWHWFLVLLWQLKRICA